jgi:hypothetical protein
MSGGKNPAAGPSVIWNLKSPFRLEIVRALVIGHWTLVIPSRVLRALSFDRDPVPDALVKGGVRYRVLAGASQAQEQEQDEFAF